MNYDKLHDRIEHLINYESDDFFLNINLKEDVSNKLLDYQHLHVFNLITALRDNQCIVDTSNTGCGKTYTSIAICKQLNLRPFIICPKTLIATWKYVCTYFDINPLGIVNYETIKTGKYYNQQDDRVDCPFIEVNENGEIKWKLPYYAIIIFDEVHKCKNTKSQNGKLLLSTKPLNINNNNRFNNKNKNNQNGFKVLMLSATLSDTPASFHIFGYMLGFYNNLKQGNNWIKGMLNDDVTYIGISQKLSAINKQIYPKKGSRMRIADLGDKFPHNQVSAESYTIEKNQIEIVNKAFNDITQLSRNDPTDFILTEILKARQKLEKIKLPIIEELITDYIENGYNVVVFLNFVDNISELAKTFNTKCIIFGNQTLERRNENIRAFQANEQNIIICNIEMAEGISLHDLHGRPRVSLISPNFIARTLQQALGRIHRAGALTPALQRLIYCAGTCEETICNRLKGKLKFLSKLNDNDLTDLGN